MDPAPMAHVTAFWDALSSLMLDVIPIVVGGVLTIGGSVATMWMQRGAQRKEYRKKKIEELAALVPELHVWLANTFRPSIINDEKLPEGISPLQRMDVICTLYFPALKAPLKKVEDAQKAVLVLSMRASAGNMEKLNALAELSRLMDEVKTQSGILLTEAADIGRRL
jgi:hypothetical protein